MQKKYFTLNPKLICIVGFILVTSFFTAKLIFNWITPAISPPENPPTTLEKGKPVTIVQEVLAATVDYNKYTQAPFYLLPSNGPSDIEFTPEVMARLNTLGNLVGQYQSYLTSKHDPILVDPFLSVIWNGAIEGLYGNQFFYNCLTFSSTINEGCENGYSSGNWQVGWGIQVSQAAGHAVEDFNAAYGDGKADDAAFVQSIGQAVIDASSSSPDGKITNPSSFPSKSLTAIVSEAQSGSTASRQLLALLLMDDKLGAIAIAREVAGDIGSPQGNWAATMAGWDQSYYGNGLQKFSNRAKAIADLYTGVAGVSTGSGAGASGSQTFSLVLRPKDPDSWVINYVTANAVGGGSTGGTTGSLNIPPGMDGQCTPTGEYPSDVPGELQSKYNTQIVGYSDEYARYIYDVFTCLSDTNFKDLVGAGTTVTNVSGGSYYMLGCEGGCKITMEANLPEGNFKHILIHEFGHMIDASNRREVILRDEFSQAYDSEGGLSPYSGPFYEGQGGCPIKGDVEDFAENVAYFYQPSSGYGTGGCDNRSSYPNPLYDTNRFPLHLDVAKKTLIP